MKEYTKKRLKYYGYDCIMLAILFVLVLFIVVCAAGVIAFLALPIYLAVKFGVWWILLYVLYGVGVKVGIKR